MAQIGVLQTGGKQYLVRPGQTLKVERLNQDKRTARNASASVAGGTLEFKDLLAGHKITASVVGQGKHPKVRILKFKPKTRYKRLRGHRQPYTEIKIEKIV